MSDVTMRVSLRLSDGKVFSSYWKNVTYFDVLNIIENWIYINLLFV